MEAADADGFNMLPHKQKNPHPKLGRERERNCISAIINPPAVHSSVCFDCLQSLKTYVVVIGSQQRACCKITRLLGNLFLVQQRMWFCFGSCFFFSACFAYFFSSWVYFSFFFLCILAFFMLWCHRCLKQIGRWLEKWGQNCSCVSVLRTPALVFVLWLWTQLTFNIYIYIYFWRMQLIAQQLEMLTSLSSLITMYAGMLILPFSYFGNEGI